MVSVAVSSLGATQLHFLEPGVKVSGDYYWNTVLLNMLLPDIRSVFGDYYVFQTDGASRWYSWPAAGPAAVRLECRRPFGLLSEAVRTHNPIAS